MTRWPLLRLTARVQPARTATPQPRRGARGSRRCTDLEPGPRRQARGLGVQHRLLRRGTTVRRGDPGRRRQSVGRGRGVSLRPHRLLVQGRHGGQQHLADRGAPIEFDSCPYGRSFTYHRLDSIGARVELVEFAAQDGFLATWAPEGAAMPVLEFDRPSPVNPAVISIQVDVAAADDRDDVTAGETLAVLQDGSDAERG